MRILAPREGDRVDPLQDLQRLQDPVLAAHLLDDVDQCRGLRAPADVGGVALRRQLRLVRLEALQQRARQLGHVPGRGARRRPGRRSAGWRCGPGRRRSGSSRPGTSARARAGAGETSQDPPPPGSTPGQKRSTSLRHDRPNSSMSAFAFCRDASIRAPQAAESLALFFCRHSTTRLLPGFTSGQNCLTSSAQGSSIRTGSSAASPTPGPARTSRRNIQHAARMEHLPFGVSPGAKGDISSWACSRCWPR